VGGEGRGEDSPKQYRGRSHARSQWQCIGCRVETRGRARIVPQGIFEGRVGGVGDNEFPLAGDSGEHRGHGIPDLGDNSEELKDEATAHNKSQDD
jgi:hypothetical protein